MPYDISAIRANLQKAMSGKFVDPDEFRPEKAKDAAGTKYRFFVLPPIKAGDVLKSGPADHNMEQFYLPNGSHWINSKPYACPRVWDGSHCAVCAFGFQLLKESKDRKDPDELRKSILSQWMPSTNYMVNIFFTNWKGNPEDLRGKVKFYNAPKTCLDKWTATLMRDAPDEDIDAEDREAHGVFFDENSAFVFELHVTKDGKNNGYKTSSFVKNNGVPIPMIMNEDRTANKKLIANLLASRIDLFSKVQKPDLSQMQRLVNTLTDGDDEPITTTSATSGGFDDDEENTKQKKVEPQKVDKGSVSESLAEEAPFEMQKPKPAAQQKKASPPPSDDGDDDDIANLMKQLGDD